MRLTTVRLLYDTVGFTLNQRLAAIQGRKAIVLLTDGVDSGSKQMTIVEGTSQVQSRPIARGVLAHDLWWD